MSKQKVKRDIYQEVTDRIIEQLEAGTPSWVKPWKGGNSAVSYMPYNADSKRAYSGINVLMLMSSPYSSNGWLTYKQAHKRGGQVIKGNKGTLVTLFKKATGSKTNSEGDKESFSYYLIRGYTVFNLEQIEWTGTTDRKTGETIPANPPEQPSPDELTSTTADQLAAAVQANVRVGGNKACYIPSADQICIPALKQFSTQDEYDSTLLHELTHWTGHTSRMDRMKNFGKRFGDDAYAFEELVAELGQAFLCAQMGIPHEQLQHSSYIAIWLKVLKGDKKAIFTASSQARQSNEWIHENSSTALEELAA